MVHKEEWDQQVQEVKEEEMELWDLQVPEVLMVLWGLLESQVAVENLDHLVTLVHLVIKEHLEWKVLKEVLVYRVQEEIQENLVLQALLEKLVLLVNLVKMETREVKDLLVHLGFLDYLVQEEKLELLAVQVHWELKAFL